MKLETAMRKFKNQWLAFEYKDEAKNEGQVLYHEKTRRALSKKLDLRKVRNKVYITFTGQLLPKNCSILFPIL